MIRVKTDVAKHCKRYYIQIQVIKMNLFNQYGFPEKFLSDQGQTFVGKVMRNLYKLAGIN